MWIVGLFIKYHCPGTSSSFSWAIIEASIIMTRRVRGGLCLRRAGLHGNAKGNRGSTQLAAAPCATYTAACLSKRRSGSPWPSSPTADDSRRPDGLCVADDGQTRSELRGQLQRRAWDKP